MKTKLYFGLDDDEFCYPKQHFLEEMDIDDLTGLEVYEAEREGMSNFFWCKEYSFCAERGMADCGRECNEYEPRNGKSGCCKHHTNQVYGYGKKVIIKKGDTK